ncbi:putative 4,5:9,10-diseco-3-hydroxy-5,9,17-trioxoandrosta-1(10),2-diene-4-oate hydrolase [Streptomyces afghaniensis 772]|uniref:Putative 4,5:9,10-diseco-3-hydroxy-5,9,17-trioxoandrosta-1(10), 2-diene-4-oate hydrolase n=1 Tax=Streptomyces afghaniensis 772 TaxID=1283301 RepID=S4MBT5_9ACTN|nr:alpha/beta hydrolase [Streptomyces afghaniensis]EPJ36918.1 putative 4,5:9,10-diseco-3-hydroxy-5,9,17-trioxoandrosta-1(10),2-diene-4-oate hydrolase [Streptomyces afghaniensis 772]
MAEETATGGKPTVYLVHGLLGTGYAHFSRQIGAWRDRYRVIPVDLPGHGRCPRDAEEDYFDGALRHLVTLVHGFGRGRLVGASYLGGPLAFRCAATRPDLVSSLVLTGFAPDAGREAFLSLIAGFDRLAAEQPALAAEYERLHTGRWKQTLAAVTGHCGRDFERTVLVRSEDLASLRVPVFILNGSLKSAEKSAAERADGLGGRVRGRVVEGAGHLVCHDRPEEFNEAVEAFWQTSERDNA